MSAEEFINKVLPPYPALDHRSLEGIPSLPPVSAAELDHVLEARVKPMKEELPKKIDLGSPATDSKFNSSGSKYLRDMKCLIDGKADVYAILETFNVTCPARQHAVKKLLCAGLRGKGDEKQDLIEARDAVDRALQMQITR